MSRLFRAPQCRQKNPAVFGRNLRLFKQQLLLVQLFRRSISLLNIYRALKISADNLLFCRFSADRIIRDRKPCHVDAHVRRRLVRALTHNSFENLLQHRENLNVPVIVDRRLSVSFQMERINHVHIREVGGCRLVGKIDRVLERQVPNRERLELRVAGFDAAFVFLINLGKAGCHFAAAGAGRRDDNKVSGRLNVIVPSVAFVA